MSNILKEKKEINLLFSIIIPLYNKENYIEDCVNSVLEQTYKNIEILIVDDKSTDDSVNRIMKIDTKDCNIQIIKNQVNSGVGFSRNKGLKVARGNYIIFLDADDKFDDKNALEYLYNVIVTHSPNYIVLERNYYGEYLKPNINRNSQVIEKITEDLYKITDNIDFAFKGKFPFGGSASAMVSRDSIGIIQFNINEKQFEDWSFFSKIFLKTNNCLYYKKPIIKINYNENSLSRINRASLSLKLPAMYTELNSDDNYKKLRKLFFWFWAVTTIKNLTFTKQNKKNRKKLRMLMCKNIIFNKYSLFTISLFIFKTIIFSILPEKRR